jgi:AraC family transcriptional regulator
MRVLSGSFCGTQVAKREISGLHVVETVYQPHESLPWHAHQWPFFTVVLRGGYTEQCQGESSDITEGDVVLHEAGERHADRIHGVDSCLLNLELSQPWLERLGGLGARLASRCIASGDGFLQLGNRLHRELWSSDAASSLCIEALALELIAGMARRRAAPSGRPVWLKRAVDYLHANFRSCPTLQDVAEAAGIHPVHLAREFRRLKGLTVGGYIRRLRVELVCRELVTSDATIVDIALKAGFCDHSHMTRVFRQQTGVTPTEFRVLRRRA